MKVRLGSSKVFIYAAVSAESDFTLISLASNAKIMTAALCYLCYLYGGNFSRATNKDNLLLEIITISSVFY